LTDKVDDPVIFKKTFLPTHPEKNPSFTGDGIRNNLNEQDAKLLYLDVSEFVQTESKSFSAAHNDIYDAEMASLLYEMVQKYAKNESKSTSQN